VPTTAPALLIDSGQIVARGSTAGHNQVAVGTTAGTFIAIPIVMLVVVQYQVVAGGDGRDVVPAAVPKNSTKGLKVLRIATTANPLGGVITTTVYEAPKLGIEMKENTKAVLNHWR
jgi:hypothetical protein